MKPEGISNDESRISKDEVGAIELTEDEKLVMKLLADNSPMDLNELIHLRQSFHCLMGRFIQIDKPVMNPDFELFS